MLAGGVAARPTPRPSPSAPSAAPPRATTVHRARTHAVMAIPSLGDFDFPTILAQAAKISGSQSLASQDLRRGDHRLHLPERDVPRQVLHPAIRRQDDV